MRAPALVFDVYGTLLNTQSVASQCEAHFSGHGAALSTLWRSKQLEYTWLRSMMGRYVDFQRVTEEALVYASQALGINLSHDARADLLQCYERLDSFGEVQDSLSGLSAYRRLVLSNGTLEMVRAALAHADLLHAFEAVLSVDALRIYKPSPRVYALAAEYLGCAPGEVVFISSNGWDIAGAAHFGFRTCWLNRENRPFDQPGLTPTHIVQRLDQLHAAISSP
jgi:2-haloacid dehalogenase